MSRVSSYLSCNWKTGGWNLRRIGFNTVISIASLYLNWKYLKFPPMERPEPRTLTAHVWTHRFQLVCCFVKKKSNLLVFNQHSARVNFPPKSCTKFSRAPTWLGGVTKSDHHLERYFKYFRFISNCNPGGGWNVLSTHTFCCFLIANAGLRK